MEFVWMVITIVLVGASCYIFGEWRGSKHYYEPVVPATPKPEVVTPTTPEPTLPEIEQFNRESEDAAACI